MNNNNLIDFIALYDSANEIDLIIINHFFYYTAFAIFIIFAASSFVSIAVAIRKNRKHEEFKYPFLEPFPLIIATFIIIAAELLIVAYNDNLYDQAVKLRSDTICTQMSTAPRVNTCIEANRTKAISDDEDLKLYVTKPEAQSPDMQLCLQLKNKDAAFECAKTLIQK